MQRVLARTLAFKHTPVLTFKPDRRLELGDRVLALLNEPAESGDDREI
jgi:ribosome-binding factor A